MKKINISLKILSILLFSIPILALANPIPDNCKIWLLPQGV